MNEIFNDGHMIIHDDREFITIDEACDLLMNGKSIGLCDHPDFGAENDYVVHSMPFYVYLKDVLCLETYQNLHKFTDEKIKLEIIEYIRCYEISK
jgi:hypothetical protein